MRRVLAAVLCGVLFGVGLALAQMIDPNKVLAFLDLAGTWDPSLILVMGGGAGVTALLFPWVLRRSRPRLDSQFHLPAKRRVDGQLLSGAALFGIGWGLAGYCPGPALVALTLGTAEPWLFVAAMIAGSLACKVWLDGGR
ncbi:YeeE/YedE family protein [Immundisolibacter cernigliae]|uniref:YeeE/YedE family protein n=1 Tax=Immundisolibacter cernigliae TaxID=1810504 RepID=A0A1B1YW15_9GAMM|nr:YeeE/YedE family protein [Immundisolibacter cernigliae]ANX04972.1 YeeE/YedE family protein [Immundisolibacter cernigliae]